MDHIFFTFLPQLSMVDPLFFAYTKRIDTSKETKLALTSDEMASWLDKVSDPSRLLALQRSSLHTSTTFNWEYSYPCNQQYSNCCAHPRCCTSLCAFYLIHSISPPFPSAFPSPIDGPQRNPTRIEMFQAFSRGEKPAVASLDDAKTKGTASLVPSPLLFFSF
jgi:hypothetical protein